MEKKKIGRPTDNPRTKQLTLRLSENELNRLNRCSESMGEPRINVVVKGIELVEQELKSKKK